MLSFFAGRGGGFCNIWQRGRSGCFTVFYKAQTISINPELKLGERFVDGSIRYIHVHTVVRFRCQPRLSLHMITHKALKAARWRLSECLASRNSNWELFNHFLTLRPIVDTICHTLLEPSSLRHRRRVWMVMSAFLRVEMTSTVFPWRYQHRLWLLLRTALNTQSEDEFNWLYHVDLSSK